MVDDEILSALSPEVRAFVDTLTVRRPGIVFIADMDNLTDKELEAIEKGNLW